MQPNVVAQPPAPTPKPLPSQSMDVVAQRPTTPSPVSASPAPVPVDQTQTSKPTPTSDKNPTVLPGNAKQEPTKQKSLNGSNETAIVATVVIILGLAAMAVYAYVRQMA
jgi:hypothetical protein